MHFPFDRTLHDPLRLRALRGAVCRVVTLALAGTLAVPAGLGAQASRADSLELRRIALRAAEASGDSAAIAITAEDLGLEHWRGDRFDSNFEQVTVGGTRTLLKAKSSFASPRVNGFGLRSKPSPSPSSASRHLGKRSISAARATCASSRASGAPRQ